MNKFRYFVSFFILFITLQACTAPYFGYTKKDWDKLTDQQKADIKEEYQTIIDSRNEQAHTDKINDRTQSILEFAITRPDR